MQFGQVHQFRLYRFAFASLCFAVGCVEVPDNVRAQFAAPSPAERSNYRPGQHGSARPRVEPASATTATATNEGDAGPAATTTTTSASGSNPEDGKDAKDAGVP